MANVQFAVVELQRAASGTLVETGRAILLDSQTQSSPQDGFDIPAQLNTNRTVYPGRNGPIEQIISSEIGPVSWNGKLDEKYLDSEEVHLTNFTAVGRTVAESISRAFLSIQAAGSPVRVQILQWSMVGLIKSFTPTIRQAGLIEWALELSVHFLDSPSGAATPRAPSRSASKPQRTLAEETDVALDKALEEQEAAIGLPVVTADYSGTENLLTLASSTQGEVNEAVTSGLTEDATGTLSAQQERFGDLAQTAGAVPLVGFAERSSTALGFQTAPSVLGYEQWSRGVRASSRRLALAAVAAERETARLVSARPRAIVTPFAGQSVYQIAIQQYGTAEGWRAIMEANNLQFLTFDGTEELIIPEERSV